MTTKVKKQDVLDSLFEEFDKNSYEKVEAKMSLSSWIAQEIKTHYGSKDAFAKAIGQKNSVISKWLSGTHNYTFDTLYDIQTKLNIKILNLDPPLIEKKFVFNQGGNKFHLLVGENRINVSEQTDNIPVGTYKTK